MPALFNLGPIRVNAGTAFTLAVLALSAPQTFAADPTTAPITQPNGSLDALTSDVETQYSIIHDVMNNADTLTDPEKRKAVSTKTVPSLKKLVSDFTALITADPDNAPQAADRRAEFLMFLSLFGDPDATHSLSTEAASTNPKESLEGKRCQLMVDWLSNAKNVDAQTRVVNQLDTLAHQNPDSIALTIQLHQMSHMGPASPDLSKRLLSLVTDVMKNDVADEAKVQIEINQKLLKLENKPALITGKQPDGKDFSSANWKGKVILVDFWAVWCDPCRAEIPGLIKTYQAYHDKGLEIVGVSNDYQADQLAKFITQTSGMVWPQLFDPTAAATHQLNPIARGFGIQDIPVMFLIDKKGILRSVSARENLETLIPQLLDEK